eukprot:GHUV01037964.1.p1 GENE.GHUV01037964.1~~GHUV01037964.1.p1  ORF type:complete len:128 (+),score=45.50 GHUV01037964.1:404-787(+)
MTGSSSVVKTATCLAGMSNATRLLRCCSQAHTQACSRSCRSLPLTIEPTAGTVQPGSTTTISAKLAAAEVGAITGELVITIAGRQEPYRQSISATVVQQSYDLTDTSNAAISEVGAAAFPCSTDLSD